MSAQRPRVLVVEDEAIVAAGLQESLEELGYDAYATAADADEAIRLAAEQRPDVVLMDIHIAGERDGIETATVLSERFEVPVVYLTAFIDDATVERAKASAPYGYLSKPVRTSDLKGTLEVVLFRHGLEREVRERERWFATTLRSLTDAVVTVDLRGNVTFLNPAAEALLGVDAETAVGEPFSSVLDESRHAPISDGITEGLNDTERVERTSEDIIGHDGDVKHIDRTVSRVLDGNRPLGVAMVVRDLTEAKAAERKLELVDRMASLGTMAAGVAHELRNPLTVLRARSSLLLEEYARLESELLTAVEGGHRPPLLAALRDIANSQIEIAAAGERMQVILSDLRAFVRPEPTGPGGCDVHAAIATAIRTTAHEVRLAARVATRLENVPPVDIDQLRLVQVLVNLLVNAAHAIGPGKAVENEISLATYNIDSERVAIDVSDTGPGVPAELEAQLFEPFFTTKGREQGTGLGLSICRGILTARGGELRLERGSDRGALFRVVLRLAAETASEVVAPEPTPPFRRGRILVIDDDKMILEAIVRVLRRHEVVVEQSGTGALTRIRTEAPFDLILSDMMMPAMTGPELYEQLLRENPSAAARVVFVSGGAETDLAKPLQETLPNRFIQKPFEVNALRAEIQRFLHKLPPASGDPGASSS